VHLGNRQSKLTKGPGNWQPKGREAAGNRQPAAAIRPATQRRKIIGHWGKMADGSLDLLALGIEKKKWHNHCTKAPGMADDSTKKAAWMADGSTEKAARMADGQGQWNN